MDYEVIAKEILGSLGDEDAFYLGNITAIVSILRAHFPEPVKDAREQINLLDATARVLAKKLRMAERDRDLAIEERDRARARLSASEHEPGEVIAECSCPVCGASLSVEYGDDEGEIVVIGTAVKEENDE